MPLEKSWPLGEPDLVVTAPAFTVPATGIIEYQYPAITNPLDHDVWVRAVSIQPGETKTVHHVLIGTSEPDIPLGEKRFDGLCSLRFLYISETDLQHNILLGGIRYFITGITRWP